MHEAQILLPSDTAPLGAAEAATVAGDPLAPVRRLPLRLVLETAVVDFTVRSLMTLTPGTVLETAAQQNEDLMLQVNGQPVGPVKFDVSGDSLAVRLTGVA